MNGGDGSWIGDGGSGREGGLRIFDFAAVGCSMRQQAVAASSISCRLLMQQQR